MKLLDLTVQRVADAPVPTDDDFRRWAAAAFDAAGVPAAELTVRLVPADESAGLNGAYRDKPRPTNVLSFGYGDALPPGQPLAGDLVICPEVVLQEAAEQGKPADHHWAHLTVHGVLHLCGMDHATDPDAARMEALETRILADLNIADPYLNDAA